MFRESDLWFFGIFFYHFSFGFQSLTSALSLNIFVDCRPTSAIPPVLQQNILMEPLVPVCLNSFKQLFSIHIPQTSFFFFLQIAIPVASLVLAPLPPIAWRVPLEWCLTVANVSPAVPLSKPSTTAELALLVPFNVRLVWMALQMGAWVVRAERCWIILGNVSSNAPPPIPMSIMVFVKVRVHRLSVSITIPFFPTSSSWNRVSFQLPYLQWTNFIQLLELSSPSGQCLHFLIFDGLLELLFMSPSFFLSSRWTLGNARATVQWATFPIVSRCVRLVLKRVKPAVDLGSLNAPRAIPPRSLISLTKARALVHVDNW